MRAARCDRRWCRSPRHAAPEGVEPLDDGITHEAIDEAALVAPDAFAPMVRVDFPGDACEQGGRQLCAMNCAKCYAECGPLRGRQSTLEPVLAFEEGIEHPAEAVALHAELMVRCRQRRHHCGDAFVVVEKGGHGNGRLVEIAAAQLQEVRRAVIRLYAENRGVDVRAQRKEFSVCRLEAVGFGEALLNGVLGDIGWCQHAGGGVRSKDGRRKLSHPIGPRKLTAPCQTSSSLSSSSAS
jgi:hypothetical protein